MRKIILFFMSFLCLSVSTAFCEDLKFIQIDNTMYSPENQASMDSLKNFVKEVNKMQNVDFVVFTGNNISKPSKEYLESFVKETNKLKTPYYISLGNKEVNKQKKFGKKEYLAYLNKKVKTFKKIDSFNYIFIKKHNIFIVLDGAKEVISSSAGYYRPETLEWLDTQLSIYHDKNVVIIQHFPVVPPAKKDSRYTYKADEYLNILSKHHNVRAVFAGNFGVSNEQKANEVIHFATEDAPAYRVIDVIDCDTSSPMYWSTVKK